MNFFFNFFKNFYHHPKYHFLFILFFFKLSFSVYGYENILPHSPKPIDDSLFFQRKINVKIVNKTFRNVLEKLTSEYGINFIYVEEQIPWQNKISMVGIQKPLLYFLNGLVKNTNLTYLLLDDQVALVTATLKKTISIDSSGSATILKDTNTTKIELKNFKKVNFTVFKKQKKNNLKIESRSYYIKKNNFPIGSFQQKELKDTSIYKHDTLLQRNIQQEKKTTANKSSGIEKHKISIRFTYGWVSWQVKAINKNLVENGDWNHYQKSTNSYGIDIMYEKKLNKNIGAAIGIGFLQLQKKGTSKSIKKNLLLPFTEIIDVKSYSNVYTYLTIPLGINYTKNIKKFSVSLGVGIQNNIFLGSNVNKYPVYKTQFFTDLNLLSKGNGKYYDRQGSLIVLEKIKYRYIVHSYKINFEFAYFLTSSFNVFTSAGLNGFMYSIYRDNPPMKEVPFEQYIALGVSCFY